MKVCILTTSFPARKNHHQSPFIYELAKNLHKNGMSVDVVCPHYSESEKMEETWGGVRIHRFKYWFTVAGQRLTSGGGIPSALKNSFLAKVQLPFFLLAYYLKAKKYTKKCDVIHAQWSLSAMVGKWLKKKYKKPLVLTERGAAANLAIKNRITKRILVNILNNCDFVTANNLNQVGLFRKLGIPENRILAVPNGIDTEKFRLRDKEDMREKLGLPKERKIVLFVGWLIERKGCKYLIEAIRKVVKEHPDTLLLVVGDGIQKRKLESRVMRLKLGENVKFVGAKPAFEVPFYMNSADILVLPSLSEGRPNVVGEAMASGLPVIATNVNGTPEFIDDNKNGLLIRPRSAGEIARRISSLLNDNSLAGRLGGLARESIMEKKLGWSGTSESYKKVYSSVLKNGKGQASK